MAKKKKKKSKKIKMKKSVGKTMLVDADIVAYHCATESAVELMEGEDEWVQRMQMGRAKEEVTSRIDSLQRETGCDKVLLCFSSPSNWRRKVLRTYKANRTWRKPLGYSGLVAWMMGRWPSDRVAFLEADDLIGLYHTSDKYPNGTVSVSEDKDLRTIPGQLYNPRTGTMSLITEEQADINHMIQTLTGDSTDGYKGCLKVGAVGAEKIVLGWKTSHASLWDAVVHAFEKDGTEADAIQQARVAFILRDGYYDFETGDLTTWTPE